MIADVRTEAGDPLQLGTDPADRARHYRYHRITRAAPLAPIHGRKLGIEVDHGDIVTLLYRGDGKVNDQRGFPGAPLRVADCNRSHGSPHGSACAHTDRVQLAHTTIIGVGIWTPPRKSALALTLGRPAA